MENSYTEHSDVAENLPARQPVSILLVDDQPANLLALEAILEDLGHNLVKVQSGEEALSRLPGGDFALVLLDVQMPGLDGFETATLIRGREAGRHTPIIFLTAFESDRFPVERAYALGAVDYLIKPLVPAVVRGKVAGFVDFFEKTQQVKRQADQIRELERREFEQQLAQENAALREQVRLAAFGRDVGYALIQSDTLSDMLGHCAEAVVRHLDGAFARIWTLNVETNVLELQASAGLYTHLDGSHGRVPVGQFKIGKIAKERRPHLTNAVLGDPRVNDQEWAKREGMVAFAGYPLVVEDRLVGVLAMFARQPLSDATLDALSSVANGIALGVERKRGAAALREQQEWLRVTLTSIGDAVIATDTHGRVTFLNGVAEQLTGWTQAEAQGQPLEAVFDIFNEQTRQPVHNPVEKVLRDGTTDGLGNHTVLIAKGGVERPIDNSAAPIRDMAGTLIGVVLTFRDVTEKRRTEWVMRQNEARKTAILDTALDCIITMDHEGTIVEFNPAAEKTFGFSREQVIGQELCQFIIPPSQRESHRKGMAHYLATGEGPVLGKRLELPALRADGTEFSVELAITRIPTDGPPLFTAYLRDITEQKRAEQHRTARLAINQVLSQSMSAQEAATGILRAICEGLGWEVGFFWTVDAGAGVLRCLTSWHRPAVRVTAFEASSRQRTFGRGEGLPGHVWATAQSAWILDVLHATNFPRVAAAAQDGLHGAFGCPVSSGSETVGVIEFFSYRIREPDAGLLEIMNTVAGQLGQFIERIEAEVALRASEQRFRSLTGLAPVGIFETDSRGNCLFVNEKWCRLAGLTPEQAHGQGWVRALHSDDRERVGHEWYTAAQAGGEFASEYRFRSDEGTVSWLQGSAVPLKTEAGAVAGYIGTITDLTGRRAAEEQVRFQAHLLDSVGQAAIVTDPDGTITYWNRYAETLYGWTRADALGRNIVEVVVASASMGQAAEIMDRLRAGENWTGEFMVRRRDGTTFPAFVTDTPIFDDRGRLAAIIGISADISDRKRVEQALRFLADASATLAAVVDYQSTLQKVAGMAVPHFADWCAVDMVDPDGTVRRLAVAHADPAKVKLALDLQDRYPPDPNSAHGLPKVLRTGESDMMAVIPDELIVQGAQDEDHLRILRELGLTSYMCVALKGRGRVIGVISFVTAESGKRYTEADLAFAEELARRAAVAIENAQLYAELRQADRLKDEFLAMLAHELRNPLAPIRNALHIMRQPGANGDIVGQVRDMAERQVQHMARLLDDLLDVSRISRGRIELRIEAVDVAAVISRTVEAVRPLIEERQHELTVSLPSGPVQVQADPTRLDQVLTNLLNNAAKYTDPGGHVWLTAERDDGEVVLKVRDTGTGIAPDMLPRIFDLFVQAERRLDRSQGGVGIGLTLVKKLVELHGGRVEATSAGLGLGSEFVIRLPATTDHRSGDKDQTSEKAGDVELVCRRIMVVDDNQDSADSLAMMLRLAGQDVRAAYDGRSALAQAQDFQPAVVFLDIGMPGMDGYEVARRLRRQAGLESVRLAAITGWGQQEDRRRSKEAGFDFHLVKPVEPKAIEELLAGLRRAEG
jgi:PAS domain S-box-containing protein